VPCASVCQSGSVRQRAAAGSEQAADLSSAVVRIPSARRLCSAPRAVGVGFKTVSVDAIAGRICGCAARV
jgi:hypothetical protein